MGSYLRRHAISPKDINLHELKFCFTLSRHYSRFCSKIWPKWVKTYKKPTSNGQASPRTPFNTTPLICKKYQANNRWDSYAMQKSCLSMHVVTTSKQFSHCMSLRKRLAMQLVHIAVVTIKRKLTHSKTKCTRSASKCTPSFTLTTSAFYIYGSKSTAWQLSTSQRLWNLLKLRK